MTDDGQAAPLLRPYQTLAEMRDQLTKVRLSSAIYLSMH